MKSLSHRAALPDIRSGWGGYCCVKVISAYPSRLQQVQVIFQQAQNGKWNVIKHYMFTTGKERRDVAGLVRGGAYTSPVGRSFDPRKVKIAMRLLLGRTHGLQVFWTTVEVREAQAANGKWQPTPAEVDEGIEFIRRNLPPDTEDLAQLSWIIKHRTSPSPIFGWPDNVIQKAVARLSTLRGDADVETFFPLLTYDLKPVFREKVLPLILPFAKEHGLFIAGWPGVGKTPFAKIWAMLLGRYWVEEKNIENRLPAWRRGKKIERFRAKPQEIQELLMLDDPQTASINVEDWKAWFDLTESGSGDGRYSDSKYCCNGPRTVLSNEVDFAKEADCVTEVMTPQHFFDMVGKTFGSMSEAHVLAIFKRCITIIGGKHGVHVRLPSEDKNAPHPHVHRK